jgi:membrane associated rhomboid family serine protease
MPFPLYDDNPTQRPAIVTYGIIGLNVVVMLWMSQLPAERQESFVLAHGFMPARISQLTSGQPIIVNFARDVRHPVYGVPVRVTEAMQLSPDPRQVLFTPLTAMFMHGGWMHLIGNMWFLMIFGDNIEDRLGHVPYFGFYLLGGLLATLGQYLQDPASQTPMVGASGAIAAVLGAYAVTFPHARVHTLIILIVFFTIWDLPALAVLGYWFFLQFVAARTATAEGVTGGVAFLAHVSGFVAGVAIMPVLRALIPAPRRFDQPPTDAEWFA